MGNQLSNSLSGLSLDICNTGREDGQLALLTVLSTLTQHHQNETWISIHLVVVANLLKQL